MKSELIRYNDRALHFHTRYRKGAKLVDLWELAEPDLIAGQIDLVIIMGGICNITDVQHDDHGNRNFWPPNDIALRFGEIKALMSEMANNHRLLNTGTKLCFIPEAGIDLAKYNYPYEQRQNGVLTLQYELENELEDLRNFTKSLNDSLNVLTPWTLKVTHHRRASKWIPVYSRMSDGLHPTLYQAYQMAKILHKYVINMFNLQDYYRHKR